MFEGDLIQGLKMVITLFEHETKAMLEAAHFEMRILFGIYLAFVRPPTPENRISIRVHDRL